MAPYFTGGCRPLGHFDDGGEGRSRGNSTQSHQQECIFRIEVFGYDLLGNPEFSAGDVLIESVYRFKGQAAPCVILTEIDFETLDDAALRKLFVGATRATMKLVLIASERAVRQLRERLKD